MRRWAVARVPHRLSTAGEPRAFHGLPAANLMVCTSVDHRFELQRRIVPKPEKLRQLEREERIKCASVPTDSAPSRQATAPTVGS